MHTVNSWVDNIKIFRWMAGGRWVKYGGNWFRLEESKMQGLHGFALIRLQDGSCLSIHHTNSRIEKMEDYRKL